MGKYCITAANHKNVNNHCASSFKLWEYVTDPKTKISTWSSMGGKSLSFVNDLLANGHHVLSGKFDGKSIAIGAAVESELRITKNETNYKISEMPTF